MEGAHREAHTGGTRLGTRLPCGFGAQSLKAAPHRAHPAPSGPGWGLRSPGNGRAAPPGPRGSHCAQTPAAK